VHHACPLHDRDRIHDRGQGGLGYRVLVGIQRVDIGMGFEAGLAIVIIAVILDRITQNRCAAATGRPVNIGSSGCSSSKIHLQNGSICQKIQK